MTEKVLGFKEKDVLDNPLWVRLIIDKTSLVPVVSIEWLENYQKDTFMIGQKDKDLLSDAKKESLRGRDTQGAKK